MKVIFSLILIFSSLIDATGIIFYSGTSHILDNFSKDFKTGVTLCAGGFYDVSNWLSAEMNGSVVNIPSSSISGCSFEQFSLNMGPRVRFFSRRRITPFISTGFTLTRNRISMDGVSEGSNDMGLELKGGLEFQVMYNLKLDLGVRYHNVFEKAQSGHIGNIILGFMYSPYKKL